MDYEPKTVLKSTATSQQNAYLYVRPFPSANSCSALSPSSGR